MKTTLTLTIVLLALSTSAANAITSFTNLAAWQAAVSGEVLETFNGATVAPFAGAPSGAIPGQAFSGFSVTGNYNGDYVGIGSGSTLNINGTKYLAWTQSASQAGWSGSNGNGGVGPLVTLNFSAPTYAFGFNWKDDDPTDLYNLEVVGQATYANPPWSTGTGTGFFGVTSATAFNTVNFRSIQQGGAVFRGFSIDNARTSAVPEPGTLALLGLTLVGVGILRRQLL